MSGLYGRSMHRDHDGEWDFDLDWKPVESWPVFAGWLRAIRRGHAAVHRGLRPRRPDAGAELRRERATRKAWEPAVDSSDIVLDVDLMAKWVHKLSAT